MTRETERYLGRREHCQVFSYVNSVKGPSPLTTSLSDTPKPLQCLDPEVGSRKAEVTGKVWVLGTRQVRQW